jgi:hypothetical protein
MISSDDAPARRRALALKAASTFSATINLASRRALLPPKANLISRKAITWWASMLNINHGSNIVFPSCFLQANS